MKRTLVLFIVLLFLPTNSFGNDGKLGCEIERFGSTNRPVAFIEVNGVRYGLNSPGIMKYGAAWDYGIVKREGGEAQRFLNKALKLCY